MNNFITGKYLLQNILIFNDLETFGEIRGKSHPKVF